MSDIMEMIGESEELLCKGLNEINQRGELSPPSLETMSKVLDGLDHISRIKRNMSEERYNRYEARRRDSMGRFTGYNDDGYGDRGYREEYGEDYRDGGYGNRYGESYQNDDREYIEYKMRKATSEKEREKWRKKLENM